MKKLAGQEKRSYVNNMFDRIAGRYDLMNRLMTGGRDQAWRRLTVAAVGAAPGKLALDVAAGTGDLTLALAATGCRAVGLDFAQGMLQGAVAKGEGLPAAGRPTYVAGDALALPFPAETFDCLTTGFAMRNVTSVPAALAEMARVLRPGGRAACLELTPPRGRLFPPLFRLYFGHFVPLLGGLVSGQADAYAYLPASLVGFPTAEKLAMLMREAGFSRVEYRRLALGTVALHVGTK
ncbi:MAG: class I SAM-dependent methyltransferase [Chloroflexota bacterium]